MTPDSTIYEPPALPASDPALRYAQLVARALSGMVIGAGVWLCLTTLGVPNVFQAQGLNGLLLFAPVGAAVAMTRFVRSLTYAAATILLALVVIAYTPVVVAPARALIRADPLPASADAVVVLSAGVTADGFLHEQGLDRLLKGLELMGQGIAPELVVTREKREDRNVTAARDQNALAILAGVSHVISTPLVASTHDEAVAVAAIAKRDKWTRIVLVTSPFHTRRACATFERAALTVSCVPSDSRDIAVRSLDTAGDRVGAFGMWIYEMAATLQYRRKGWI